MNYELDHSTKSKLAKLCCLDFYGCCVNEEQLAIELTTAAQEGDLPKVKQLIESGAVAIDACYSSTDGTALIGACKAGQTAVVKYLVHKGADVHYKFDLGTPVLIYALKYPELVEFLVNECGAEVNEKNSLGTAPLMSATTFGNTEVVKFLISQGADVNAESQDGVTAALMAADQGWEEILKELHRNGADIDVSTRNGVTPLMCAAGRGHKSIVKFLLEQSADLDAQDNTGKSPLDWARDKGHTEIHKWLSEKLKKNQSRQKNLIMRKAQSAQRKSILSKSARGVDVTPTGTRAWSTSGGSSRPGLRSTPRSAPATAKRRHKREDDDGEREHARSSTKSEPVTHRRDRTYSNTATPPNEEDDSSSKDAPESKNEEGGPQAYINKLVAPTTTSPEAPNPDDYGDGPGPSADDFGKTYEKKKQATYGESYGSNEYQSGYGHRYEKDYVKKAESKFEKNYDKDSPQPEFADRTGKKKKKKGKAPPEGSYAARVAASKNEYSSPAVSELP